MRSRVPYIMAMIEQMLTEAIIEAEHGAVGRMTRKPEVVERGRGLTPHEVRILFLCAQGLTRQEIADALGCSIETVKSHLRNTYRKLGARNRAHALALATERGYLS